MFVLTRHCSGNRLPTRPTPPTSPPKTQQEEHKMLHGLRRWAKITDSLLLPPLLLHEVIHVERESALRRPLGSALTECESLPAHGSQMFTKVLQLLSTDVFTLSGESFRSRNTCLVCRTRSHTWCAQRDDKAYPSAAGKPQAGMVRPCALSAQEGTLLYSQSCSQRVPTPVCSLNPLAYHFLFNSQGRQSSSTRQTASQVQRLIRCYT